MEVTYHLAVFACLFSALSLAIYLSLGSSAKTAGDRILQVTENHKHVARAKARPLQKLALRIFRALRTRLGIGNTAKQRERFMSAGIRRTDYMEFHFAARLAGPLVGMVAGSFIPKHTVVWVLLLAGVAYLAPEYILDRKIKARRERIRKSIPDSLDLLVICVDAGLGLDQALLRVGQELVVSHPEINEEFLQINGEQRAGRPRIEAWKSMAERTALPDIYGFVSMLVQTERFGTPIARALSTFSDGLRLKRKQEAEEKAAKTTVKMLFPLVLFIFPCIFIVLLGPAAIAVSNGLFSMTK